MSAPGVDALADLPGTALAAVVLVGGGVLAVIAATLLVVWSVTDLIAYTVTVVVVALALYEWWRGGDA
jgi:hypothetical protein